MMPAGLAPEPGALSGVPIATESSPLSSATGESSLLLRIRQAGGTLEVPRGTVSGLDLAAASRASANEIALYRVRATGQRMVVELSPNGGNVPAEVRLILHVQPGEGPLAVMPSTVDRAALSTLGQKSSVIINSGGSYSIRFGPTSALDNEIVRINP
jgi:hypothetical protein